jgi:WD40 repeat protein
VVPEWWRGCDAGDIAILQVEGSLPQGVVPLILGATSGAAGHNMESFGFPLGPEGLRGQGRILGPIVRDTQQLLQLQSTEITTGFSGAPVWDLAARRAVGMVTEITRPDQFGRLSDTAFATPTEVLRSVCPTLQLSAVCPYRSLDVFTEDDAQFFFGRQAVVNKLLERLKHEPSFLALLGPSGCGKSSLLQAGLISQLHQGKGVPGSDQWGLISIRQFDEPFRRLEERGLIGASDGLVEATKNWLEKHPEQDRRLLLIIDQFEELLVPSYPEPLRSSFLNQLAELLETALPVTVIVAMRDDFFSPFAQQAAPLLEHLERGLVTIPALHTLRREELAAIVLEPARVVGLHFEEGLSEIIVQDAIEAAPASRDGVEAARSTVLPLLEFTLTQLWENRDEGLLTHTAYRDIGGVTRSLGKWANRAYQLLAREDRLLVRCILTDLVHLEDESQGIPISPQRQLATNLCSHERNRDAVDRVVQHLTNERLLVTSADKHTGAKTVEMIHGALLNEWGQLQDWLKEDWRFLLWRQDLRKQVTDWEQTNEHNPNLRDPDRLLRGRDLAEAEGWLKSRRADLGDEAAYIGASVALREQQRRRERLRGRLTVGAVVVLSLLAMLVVVFLREAQEQERRAEAQQLNARERLSRQLATLALTHKTDQPDLSFLLSIEANNASDTVESRNSFLGVFEANPRLLTFLHTAESLTGELSFSVDGKRVVSASDRGTLVLWDIEARPPTSQTLPRVTGDLLPLGIWYSALLSPDGKRAVLVDSSGPDRVLWDLNARPPVSMTLPVDEWPVTSMAFSQDGSTLTLAVQNGNLVSWDLRANPPISRTLSIDISKYLSPFSSLELSPDGRRVALIGDDGKIILWNAENGTMIGELSTGRRTVGATVVFNPDSKMLAHVDLFGLSLWDLEASPPVSFTLSSSDSRVPTSPNAVAFSSDSTMLAYTGEGNVIRLWSVEDRRPTALGAINNGGSGYDIAFSPNGKTLVASGGTSLQLWSLVGLDVSLPASSTPPISNDPSQPNIPYPPPITPSDQLPPLSNNSPLPSDQPIQLGLGRFLKLDQPLRYIPYLEAMTNVALSMNGNRLALGREDGSITLWDVGATPPAKQTVHYKPGVAVVSVALNPDGGKLATGSRDGAITLWDFTVVPPINQTLIPAGTGVVDSHHVPTAAFSQDNNMLALVDAEGTLSLWNLASNPVTVQGTFKNGVPVSSIVFSKNGQSLALSASVSGDISIWDIKANPPVSRTLHTGPGGAPLPYVRQSLSYASDDQVLASVSPESTVILWDLNSAPVSSYTLVAGEGPISRIAMNPAGDQLAVGGELGTASLWSVIYRQPIGRFLAGSVQSLTFTPDGDTLTTVSSDGALAMWDVSLDSWRTRACQIANRNLTQKEWSAYLPDEPYRKTCPSVP